jgi:hypothetical protein
VDLDVAIDIDVEPALDSHGQSDQDEGIEDLYENIGDDFDNIDVDVEIDVNHKAKLNKEKQIAIAAELAAAENISEFDDDYLQDDIPIDDDDEDDSGDGIADDVLVEDVESANTGKVGRLSGGAPLHKQQTEKISSHVSSSPSLKASMAASARGGRGPRLEKEAY